MKERPIIFSTGMVKAILAGNKTQTRRVIKLPKYPDENPKPFEWIIREGVNIWIAQNTKINYQEYTRFPYGQVGDRLWVKTKYRILEESKIDKPDYIYGLLDDRLYAILTSEVYDGRYDTIEWNFTESNTNITERRLYGWFGRSNILQNEIQRLWSQGIRGLVSAKRASNKERILHNINESSWKESNQICSQIDMHGFSWDTTNPIISGEAFRWEQKKQSAGKFDVGNTRGKLDGQKNARNGERRGKTSNGEINRFRNESSTMDNTKRISQSTSSSKDSWYVPGWHISRCSPETLIQRPSIFMPRWASRITLEIQKVRVERVQDIIEDDAMAEGIEPILEYPDEMTNKTLRHIGAEEVKEPYQIGWKDYLYKEDRRFHYYNPNPEIYLNAKSSFQSLWDSINAKRGYSWESNPYVWVIEFKRINE